MPLTDEQRAAFKSMRRKADAAVIARTAHRLGYGSLEEKNKANAEYQAANELLDSLLEGDKK